MKTLGEIAKSHGFDSVSDYVEAVNKVIETEKNQLKLFNAGDKIKLKSNFEPTHFEYEKGLPANSIFTVSEKSNFTIS